MTMYQNLYKLLEAKLKKSGPEDLNSIYTVNEFAAIAVIFDSIKTEFEAESKRNFSAEWRV